MFDRTHTLVMGHFRAPMGFGDLERKTIFRELGSTGNFYFQGSGKKAHILGDLGSPAKSKNHIAIGFLSNTGLDPLKITKQPS